MSKVIQVIIAILAILFWFVGLMYVADWIIQPGPSYSPPAPPEYYGMEDIYGR